MTILALLRTGNPAAAIAQIKVAPSVRELKALEKALAAAHLQGKALSAWDSRRTQLWMRII